MTSVEVKEKWRILASAWRDTGPPAAPSPLDVSNYILHLPSAGAFVLVLGCTPALRNRLCLESYTVMSIDITREMIDVTAPLVVRAGGGSMIQGDWLQMPLCDNSFDAVIGDKVLGNMMPDDWPIFFAEVKRVLRPDGVFLTRASPHGIHLLEPPQQRSFSDLVVKWATFQKSGMKLDDACSGLWEDCMDISTDHINPHIGTQQLCRVIPITEAECVNEAGIDSVAISLVQTFIHKYWSSRNARWSAYTIESILQSAGIYFEYVNTYSASDYPEGNRQPVFHFIRRI